MEIGNTVEISDQNFYLGVVFIKSGDRLLDPKFRLMTHIRRYGGLEINFKNCYIINDCIISIKLGNSNLVITNSNEKNISIHFRQL